MLYRLHLSDFPTVTRLYTVERDTVWQITEREHVLLFAKRGECRIRTAGETFLLKEGAAMFLPADRSYERTPTVGTVTLLYLHFTLPSPIEEAEKEDALRELISLKEETDGRLLSGEVPPPERTLFLARYYEDGDSLLSKWAEEINLYSSGRMSFYHLQASVALSAILTAMARRTAKELFSNPLSSPVPRVPAELKKALGYLASHPSDPVSPRDLAQACSVSPQQLVRYFRRAFGTTPVRYITEFKISRAKEMLFYRTGLSVKEVARELSFDNQHYFSRVFTSVTGETPTAYRERTQNYGKTGGAEETRKK